MMEKEETYAGNVAAAVGKVTSEQYGKGGGE